MENFELEKTLYHFENLCTTQDALMASEIEPLSPTTPNRGSRGRGVIIKGLVILTGEDREEVGTWVPYPPMLACFCR